MTILLDKIFRRLGYLISALIILAAVLVTVTRLLTPVLNEHKDDFEKLASDLLQMPVVINQARVAWNGYQPEISLENVTILDPITKKAKLEIKRFEINLNLWHSLWYRHLLIRNLTVDGVQLNVAGEASGNIQVGNFLSLNIKDKLTGGSVAEDGVIAWIFSQPLLTLKNIDVHYLYDSAPEVYLTLKAASLQNTSSHHIVNGKATLNQRMPTNMDLHFAWDGDVGKLEEAKGHFYLYLQGFSLPQWFGRFAWQDLQVKQGIASVKVWANWRHNRWEKVQSQFQVYNLELYSTQFKKSEVVERISANLGWKRDGDAQILAGDQILINFPYHLWPTSSFSIRITPDVNGNWIFNHIQISYLDLVDAVRILSFKRNLFSDQTWKTLDTLNPQGDLLALDVMLKNPLSSVEDFAFKTHFVSLNVLPWRKFPGIHNFTGDLAWDGKQGTVSINSTDVRITLGNLFLDPLYFRGLRAKATWYKDDKAAWMLDASNIQVNSQDIIANAKLNMAFLPTGFPVIDLTADFTLLDAKQITRYLPLKIFEPDLTKWLLQAFRSGSGEKGKIIVKGNLQEFPFGKQNGTFLISSKIKDLDFSFAPDWPAITHLDGELVFAEHSMNAQITSGQLLTVPITNVQGTIPYIGDDFPQILTVQGVINTDLAQGLEFIHHSPLQKNIGVDLMGVNLTGPMQLNLGLTIPLKNPSLTKVLGDVAISKGILSLPEWKLTLPKLAGSFQFTENTLTSKKLTAELFDMPVTLVMETVRTQAKPSIVRVNFGGELTLVALQNWLGMSFAPIAQGSMIYQAQLDLASHTDNQASQITLFSQLDGVALNFPVPYAKNTTEKKPTKVTVIFGDNNQLKAKINYTDLLSAALNFQKEAAGLRWVGGELRFGDDNANWQTEPGILVSGKMQTLDWDVWQAYFASFKNTTKPNEHADFSMLRGINLSTDALDVFGQQLKGAHIDASVSKNTWSIRIDSDKVVGQLTLPFDLKTQGIKGQFQRFYFAQSNKKDPQPVDPHNLPAMVIDSDDVQFEGKKMGHIGFDVVPSKSGLTIRKLVIEKPAFNLRAVGDWSVTNGKSRTHLQGTADSHNVSNALSQWGFDSTNFVGSTGDATFNLAWSGAPYSPKLAGTTGDITLNLGKGRIVQLSESSNAKMDLGRLLNIFSLSTIPRRLSLDFSDIFEKGYSFDYMKGSFTLKDGSAFTNDMRFDGPIARVAITGRVGIAQKDFDFKLSVTPYVTSSLPVVAAIAGGPIAGVATWMVDKVISREVNKATIYDYNVTGTWDEPIWQELGKKPVVMSSPVVSQH